MMPSKISAGELSHLPAPRKCIRSLMEPPGSNLVGTGINCVSVANIRTLAIHFSIFKTRQYKYSNILICISFKSCLSNSSLNSTLNTFTNMLYGVIFFSLFSHLHRTFHHTSHSDCLPTCSSSYYDALYFL